MFEAISAWLISEECRRRELSLVMAGLAERLAAEGLPVWRMHVSVLAMHPEVFGRSARWTRDGGVTIADSKRELFSDPAYVGSSIEAIHHGLDRVRARLEKGELPYPQLKELRETGATDYAAFAL